jgi:hypothetical protein
MNFLKSQKLYLSISLVISLLFISTTFVPKVYGQSHITFKSELDLIKERTKWRLGPFMIYPTLQFSLSHDDNIYGSYGTPPPISDYVATVLPQMTVYLPFRNWLILSLLESPQYAYFAETKSERAFNNSYFPALRMLLFNRLVLSAGYQKQRMKYRPLTEVERRIFQEIKGYSGSIFIETARDTALGFSVSKNQIGYGDVTLAGEEIPVSRTLNREEKNWRVEFYYTVFQDTFFFANMGYTDYKFVFLEGSFRDSFSYQAYGGIRFPLLGRARGTLSLGYKKFYPKNKSLEGYSGLVGNTSLDFRLGRFGFRIQYVRDVPFSYYTSNIFYLDNRYGAGLSFYLNRSIRLDYDFSSGRGVYPDAMLLPLPDGTYEEIKRIDIDTSHSAGLVFRIIQNTGIGITVNYYKRTANYYLFKVNRILIGAFITYEF